MGTESVLAAMFASPALNLVVLAMTFALFPLPIALLKLATVLFLILVFVPFISARQGSLSRRSISPSEFLRARPGGKPWPTPHGPMSEASGPCFASRSL